MQWILVQGKSFMRSTDSVKVRISQRRKKAMAFQAPAWTLSREFTEGVREMDYGMTGEIDRTARAGQGCGQRPCPESGTSCGTDRRDSAYPYGTHNGFGMKSCGVAAKPERRDCTPGEGSLRAHQLQRGASSGREGARAL